MCFPRFHRFHKKSKLSMYQQQCIDSLKYTPEEVCELNEHQCEVLLKLNYLNIKPSDIKDATWLNSGDQISGLASLIEYGKFTIKVALEQLKDLKNDEIMEMERHLRRLS